MIGFLLLIRSFCFLPCATVTFSSGKTKSGSNADTEYEEGK